MREERRTSEPQKASQRYGYRRLISVAFQFALLFGIWLIFSGRFGLKYLVMGLICVSLVTFLTNDLLYYRARPGGKAESGVLVEFMSWWRLLLYVPWLFLAIVKANLQVAYLVLHPRMPIDPVFLQFRTGLRKRLSQVTLANSITLTPGTVSVNLEEGRYTVHALVPRSGQDLVEGRMQNKVAEIFLDEQAEPPQVRFAHSLEELEP
ncbi:MAG TPA: Na+/H+ antiporter subunit E [Dehalococcoidia bacterium]|jgi:multicomponent Na+:H+ antiporter subunit E|nr:Na+/H+ antiporter subunit E [Dehalococcoidia bacterium]